MPPTSGFQSLFRELTDPDGYTRLTRANLHDLQQVLSSTGKLKEDGMIPLLAITGWQNVHN